ncbi:hypothetical protein PORY_001743 [Pneumocystis oryctolagi]|uniref:Uncharacterized protein n=1 Tax=Pneumocystis oryctolagi TaxID=42067 RepID=A0ACB7CCD4_9ASCO|nr:hypothetical protein PORY_001743 [Pneumocystis oryctolagi]
MKDRQVEVWDDNDLWGDVYDYKDDVMDNSVLRDSKEERSFEDEMMAKDIHEVMEKAEKSGIPLPRNITPSALMGGTILRLGTRKAGVAVMDDWGDDLQLTSAILNGKIVGKSATVDDEDVFKEIDDWSTKPQTAVQKRLREGLLPRKSTEPSFAQQNDTSDDAFEKDFDIPSGMDDFQIHYPSGKIPQVPSMSQTLTLESDNDDWGDSSLGIRSAGGESRSARASVASSLSPSMSSITLSEDEGILDGIELPSAALDLQKRFNTLKQKKMNEYILKDVPPLKEDFFVDIEMDDDLFYDSSKKLNSNVNIIKHMADDDVLNLQRKPQATIKFSSKTSRIPQPIFPSVRTSRDNVSKTPCSGAQAFINQEKMVSKKPSLMNFRNTEDEFHIMSTKRSMPSLQVQHPSPSQYVSDSSRLKSNLYNAYHNQSKTVIENGHSKTHSNTSNMSGPRYSKGSDDFSWMINKVPRYASPTNASLARGATLLNKSQKYAFDKVPQDYSPIKIITRPRKLTNFGDGTELDAFDDLPTCPSMENRYPIKTRKEQPKYKDISDSQLASAFSKILEIDKYKDRESCKNTVHPVISRQNNLKTPLQVFPNKIKLKKKNKQMPTLIRNLNSSPIPKVIGQMKYNPQTRIWEGNEIELQKFDLNTTSPPRPALISHISDKKNIQIVGDMMFDPEKMCWIKIYPSKEDENDPFEGIKDLTSDDPFVSFDSGKDSRNSLSNSNYLDTHNFTVGEEFDVGPGFIRKQKEQEENWKKNIQGWIRQGLPNRSHLREIREIVINGR